MSDNSKYILLHVDQYITLNVGKLWRTLCNIYYVIDDLRFIAKKNIFFTIFCSFLLVFSKSCAIRMPFLERNKHVK